MGRQILSYIELIPGMLIVRFLIYLFSFHGPFTLILHPMWGSEKIAYFILPVVFIYFPFLFWEMDSCLRKGRDYRVTRNHGVAFSLLVSLHWLMMIYWWTSPSRFILYRELVFTTIIYCGPWLLFAWVLAKIFWNSFQPNTTRRRRIAGIVLLPIICILFGTGIFFYTIIALMAVRGP